MCQEGVIPPPVIYLYYCTTTLNSMQKFKRSAKQIPTEPQQQFLLLFYSTKQSLKVAVVLGEQDHYIFEPAACMCQEEVGPPPGI
jgi:predicted nucleic acid-binding Zn finger protein